MPSPLTLQVTATMSKDDLMSALHSAVLGDTFDITKWSDLDADELISAGQRIKNTLAAGRKPERVKPEAVRQAQVRVPDLERNFRYGKT